ncbi:MAG: hypothetical protein Q4D91_06620 [Lautropia sp.]|nr:hypothetical protein [Lautropia sp.]
MMSSQPSLTTPATRQSPYPMAMALNYPTQLPILKLRRRREKSGELGTEAPRSSITEADTLQRAS